MKVLLLFPILLFMQLTTFAQTAENVFFLGNSLTYYNDMPHVFGQISNDKGRNVNVKMYAPGGTGFVNHVNDNALYDSIRNNQFDIVIMQPGTSESGGASYTVNVTAQRGLVIMDSIKKYSPCAKFFLYEISNGVISANDYPTYFTTQTRIKDSLSLLSELMQVPLIPAGECFRNHYEATPDLLLHNSYGDVHPNLNGSYLVACSAFAAIYRDSVEGTTVNAGIAQQTAEYLQGIADDIVLSSLSLWNLDEYNPFAEFDLAQNGDEITLTNLSQNYDSVTWDFGDGMTSNLENPVHSFSANGVYQVTLTIFADDCEYTVSQEVTVSGLGIVDNEISKLIYPNPTYGILKVVNDGTMDQIHILNANGMIVRVFEPLPGINQFDVSELAAGYYWIELHNSLEKRTIQFVKQ